MALKYELEKHITNEKRKGNNSGVEGLMQMQETLNALIENEGVEELPRGRDRFCAFVQTIIRNRQVQIDMLLTTAAIVGTAALAYSGNSETAVLASLGTLLVPFARKAFINHRNSGYYSRGLEGDYFPILADSRSIFGYLGDAISKGKVQMPTPYEKRFDSKDVYEHYHGHRY